eukprot:7354535-Prymnesium_polylepis.1
MGSALTDAVAGVAADVAAGAGCRVSEAALMAARTRRTTDVLAVGDATYPTYFTSWHSNGPPWRLSFALLRRAASG